MHKDEKVIICIAFKVEKYLIKCIYKNRKVYNEKFFYTTEIEKN